MSLPFNVEAFEYAKANTRAFIADLGWLGVPLPLDTNLGEMLAWTFTRSDGYWSFVIGPRAGRPCRVRMPGVPLKQACAGLVGVDGSDRPWGEAVQVAQRRMTAT